MAERTCSRCGKPRQVVCYKLGDPVCRVCKAADTRTSKRTATVDAEEPLPELLRAAAKDKPKRRRVTLALTPQAAALARGADGVRVCAFCCVPRPLSAFPPHPTLSGEHLLWCAECKPSWNRWRVTELQRRGRLPTEAPDVPTAAAHFPTNGVDIPIQPPSSLTAQLADVARDLADQGAPANQYLVPIQPQHERTVDLGDGVTLRLAIPAANLLTLQARARRLLTSILTLIDDHEAPAATQEA